MKVGSLLVTLAVLVMAAVCVRLGFWQISRWHEKQALNVRLRAALAAPPLDLHAPLPAVHALGARRVRVRGRYDAQHQFVLIARAHDGSPGVEIVTPLELSGGARVLVDRGWVYAADAATANPLAWPESGEVAVEGMPQALGPPRAHTAPRRLPYGHDSAAVWATLVLDSAQAARLIGRPVAGYLVRALPGPKAPPEPVRIPPRPYDESMHISYAVQWFTFAAILLGGSSALALSRRRRTAPVTPVRDPS